MTPGRKIPDARDAVRAILDDVIATRRDLHRHPELSTEEHRTQRCIIDRLHALGLDDVREIADTGVTGVVRGGAPGPSLLWRADIDGLPLQEETGLPFASETAGVMHACGHDGHTAIALGLASLLHAQRDRLRGGVRFAFQPAEERIGGARRMIDQGALDGVDRVFGLHIWATDPTGEVRVAPGPIFAAATHFRIIVRGHGGHASAPHETIDPIVVAAHIVVALQTVVSRSVPAHETAVLTVGRLEAGVRGNIIPDEAMMSGTIRTYEPPVLSRMLDRMQEVVAGVSSAFGASCLFDHSTLPAVVNDPACARIVEDAATALLGREHVAPARTTGADDMAYFLERAHGAYFMLGGRPPDGRAFPHHHPKFDFDERCLPLGIELGLRIIENATESQLT
ncbi:MAG: amidohydrolase [Dehalococcoidia bacterium]